MSHLATKKSQANRLMTEMPNWSKAIIKPLFTYKHLSVLVLLFLYSTNTYKILPIYIFSGPSANYAGLAEVKKTITNQFCRRSPDELAPEGPCLHCTPKL